MKRSQELFAGAKKHLVSSRSRLSDQIKNLDAHRSAINNALRKMGIDKDDTLDVCISASWYRIQIQVSVRKLESFKDSRLTNLLNRLEDLNPRDVECGEWADYLEKNFTYKFDGYEIRLEASVRSDSPTCRRVVESIEIVEQPTYKIVCD